MKHADLLDDVNRKLIEGLVAEPRATHRHLASLVGLNEVTVATRIKRLVDAGVMTTTIAVDWVAAGYKRSAYLWLTCDGRPVTDVGSEVAEVDGVQNVVVVLGSTDLFTQVLLAGGDEGLQEVQSALSRVKGASVVETNLVLRHYVHKPGSTNLPITEPPLPTLPDAVIPLDELDIKLCEELAADARRSNREIGRILGTSERTVRTRIKRLEDSGLVRIVTMVDAEAGRGLGSDVSAFVGIRTAGEIESVAAALSAMPSLAGLTATTGDAELYATITASSPAELATLVLDDIRSIPGVRATTTRLVARPILFAARLRRLL